MPLAECGPAAGLPLNAQHVALLAVLGPTLLVNIGFDATYDPASGAEPISTVKGIPALIDSGASDSCIDNKLAAQLNLPIVDRVQMSGISGPYEAYRYLAQVHVPPLAFTQYGAFLGVDLVAGGQPHQALIGRSFLRYFIMIYDGVRGQVTMAR